MCPFVLALLLALMHQVAAQNLNITEHFIDDQTIPIVLLVLLIMHFFIIYTPILGFPVLMSITST